MVLRSGLPCVQPVPARMAAQYKSMLYPQTYALKDPQTSARGARTCQLQDKDGKRIHFTLGSRLEPCTTPFGASSWNDENASRKTLDFHLTDEQAAEFDAFDEWAIGYLAEHSERVFKKKLTAEQVAQNYRSPVIRKDEYRPHLRCKINTAGQHACRAWSEAEERRELPEDLRPCLLVPRINVSHLWMMSREYGWVLQVGDMMVLDNAETCPFD